MDKHQVEELKLQNRLLQRQVDSLRDERDRLYRAVMDMEANMLLRKTERDVARESLRRTAA